MENGENIRKKEWRNVDVEGFESFKTSEVAK